MLSPTPVTEGWLTVSDQHDIYFAVYGNPQGKVALVVHGGPGSGSHISMLDWFDLTAYCVVLFDQRGAGKSKARDLLTENTTQAIVQDMARLRAHLGVQRWMIVGGSWGTIPALLYAAQYPDQVFALVIRGVFLASSDELNWFFQGLSSLVPVGWQQLTSQWHEVQKKEVLQTLTQAILSGTPAQQSEAVYRWAQYESNVMDAMMGRPARPLDYDEERAFVKYRIQAHYLSHQCFVSDADMDAAITRIPELPVMIIHGSHDWICPPSNAVRLKQLMPYARLCSVYGGTHTPADPEIKSALQQAMRQLI